MKNQTPVSKEERAELFKPYSKEVGIVANDIQLSTSNPSVYVYNAEEEILETMKPIKVMVQEASTKGIIRTYGIEYEYPVARLFQNEHIELCSSTSTFIKQARKNRPSASILLVQVEGIVVSTIFIQPKKQNQKKVLSKGFA